MSDSIHDRVVAYLDAAISNARDNLYDIQREIDAGMFGEGGIRMLNACNNDLRALVRVRKNLHEYNDDRYDAQRDAPDDQAHHNH